jgi:RimJ/RimL family protein N-acetyltransferase
MSELTIRPFERRDYPELGNWFHSLAELVQWGGPHITVPLDLRQLDDMRMDPALICRSFDLNGRLVGHGQVRFDKAADTARLCRIGVSPEFRGWGLSQPIARGLLGEAFAKPWVHRAELAVYTFNVAAQRVYEAIGFRAEGINRQVVRVGEDRWDQVMMSLLRPEWRG